MRFTCAMSDFSDAIQNASRAVSTKATIPALEGILITADSKLTVSGFDLKMGITCTCVADVFNPGSVVLDARLITEISRKMPEGTLLFETDSDNNTRLSCGLSEYTLTGINGEDFPEMPIIDSSHSLSVPAKQMKRLINGTLFSVSQSDTKPIYTGVLFDLKQGMLTLVSTDNYRLSVCRQSIDTEDELNFVVPAATLREIVRILPDNDDPIQLELAERHILANFQNITIFSGLLEGQFLRYENSVSAPHKYAIEVSVPALSESLDRVSPVVNEKLKNPLRLRIENGTIHLSYISATARVKDECIYRGEVEPIDLGISNRFLADALRNIPDESCMLCYNSKMAPLTVRPIDGEDYIYIIALMRVN